MAKKKIDTVTLDTKPVRLKKDGTPWPAPDSRRSNAEMLVHYKAKRVAALARHAKEIAGIDKKIAYFENTPSSRVIDPIKANAAAQEYLGKGMTAEQILEAAEQLRLAAFALKGKSEIEVQAIANAPSFFDVTPPAPVAV